MTAKSATITVKLLNKAGLEDSLRIAAMAARTCTDTVDKATANDPVLRSCLNAGHLTIFEHINYTIAVNGISRALLQELARHRHLSLSVKSTRWTLGKVEHNHNISIGWGVRDKIRAIIDNSSWDMPKRGSGSGNNLKIDRAIEKALNSTCETFDCIEELAKLGAPADVVKYFLPEATPTNLIMTVNARELRHIIELRTATRALGEFRELCDLVLGEISEALEGEHDFIFEGVRG